MRARWQRTSTPLKAAILMLLAMALFSSMSIFIRLSTEQLPVLEVVFFRNALALLLMVPWLCRRGIGVLTTQRFGLLCTRSLVNVFGMVAGFAAIALIPLAEATALSFTAPLWATIGAVVFLGEVIRVRRVSALAVGFIGVLVVLQPGVDSITIGALLALSHAFLMAVTTLIVKRLTHTEKPDSIVVWMVLLQTPFSLIPALFVWEAPSLETWIWMWCLALTGTLGHMCWTRAYTIAEVSQLQPFEFIKLPLIGFFAYVAFVEIPSIWTWIGGTVIFISTAYISYREARLSKN